MYFYKIAESQDLKQVPAICICFLLPHTKEQIAVIGEGPVGFRGQGLGLVAGGPEGIHGGQDPVPDQAGSLRDVALGGVGAEGILQTGQSLIHFVG